MPNNYKVCYAPQRWLRLLHLSHNPTMHTYIYRLHLDLLNVFVLGLTSLWYKWGRRQSRRQRWRGRPAGCCRRCSCPPPLCCCSSHKTGMNTPWNPEHRSQDGHCHSNEVVRWSNSPLYCCCSKCRNSVSLNPGHSSVLEISKAKGVNNLNDQLWQPLISYQLIN